MTIKKILTVVLAMALFGFLGSCSNTSDDESEGYKDNVSDSGAGKETTDSATEEETADFEFDVVTFAIRDGEPQEVSINGLPLEEMSGAYKVDADTWEVVTREGVRFSDILDKAEIEVSDDTPVNCVARDNYDPLRTRLENDTTKLIKFDLFRDRGYVYVGSPGDKDPMFPEMEGKSLIVDYDVDEDADVPDYLGDTIASLGTFRWKMIEKIDDETRGIIELDPVVE
jgi:hypothetical protein